MRVLIATILVFSFIGIAMLGFISMSHKAGLAHNNCFVARTQGAACAGRNVFEIISLHFNALRSFGLAIFLAQIFTAIAAIILINTNGGIKALARLTRK
ncbi:MAG: hypothetical protein HYT12_04850 [Candidatus Liptonbacteria bacterium]|nr:hypothetical protein [Candidatus Liptonbacteria bacterium]